MVNSVWNWANGAAIDVPGLRAAATINLVGSIRHKQLSAMDGGIAMRIAGFILGIIFIFSASASAQGPVGAGSQGGHYFSGDHPNDPWQVSFGLQYNRDNLLGSPFNTYGLNVSGTRFFGKWFGVEAQMGTGFLGTTGKTTTPPSLSVKSIFFGAGPRVALRTGSRYEPWLHVVAGLEHYRFSQTAGLLGSN